MKTDQSQISLAANQQKRIQYLQYRFTPYFIIVLFSVGVTFARYFMIPEWGVLLHLGLFVLQAATLIGVWHFIKALNGYFDKRISFSNGATKRMTLQILISLAVVAPVVAVIGIWLEPHLPAFVTKQFMIIAIMLFVLVVFLFNFAFYTFYFFRNWQDSVEEKATLQVRAAELEREKFNLQYHQLRNQVNPHYLFNTLSSLDGLIQTNPELASEFVRHMSKVYRYVLQHKENEVVSVEEEIGFIQHYIELLHIRHGDGLLIKLDISDDAKEKGIVMVTLQMLIDNAIKHNIVQAESPLYIVVSDDGDSLVVQNNMQRRGHIDTSNGRGLTQLAQLYAYHTDAKIQIDDSDSCYTVRIPLL